MSADARRPEKDVFDILQEIELYFCAYLDILLMLFLSFLSQKHRLEQLQTAALAAANASNEVVRQPTASDIPNFLVRRFEVSIIPSASTKPKKLREVKADGIFLVVNTID